MKKLPFLFFVLTCIFFTKTSFSQTNDDKIKTKEIKLEIKFPPEVIKEIKIKKVKVKLKIKDKSIHKILKKRIKKSIEKVSKKVLIGKRLEEIKKNKTSLEKVLKRIFSQVITGFYVKKLSIQEGEKTKIYVYLIPEDKLLKK
jgi:hypothetical protein